MEQKVSFFLVAQHDDGRWIAASAAEPYFCFRAESEEAVLGRARSALAEYGRFRELGAPRIRELNPHQPKSVYTLRAPKKVPFSEVCAVA
jgi:hypothetical protein